MTLFTALLCYLTVQLVDTFPFPKFGDVQSYGVSGRVTCDGQPAGSLLIRLYDRDKFSADEVMAETTTSADGEFGVRGWSQELTAIEPYLTIYHHCGDRGEFLFVHCPLNFIYELPSEWVAVGADRQRTYQAGVINLRGKFRREDEHRQCP